MGKIILKIICTCGVLKNSSALEQHRNYAQTGDYSTTTLIFPFVNKLWEKKIYKKTCKCYSESKSCFDRKNSIYEYNLLEFHKFILTV